MVKPFFNTINTIALMVMLLPTLANSTDTQRFDAVYAAATAARKHAAALGHEWRDTRKLLKKAKAAAKSGDFETAVQLAEQARFQSERAVEQAEEQAKIWQDAVPK